MVAQVVFLPSIMLSGIMFPARLLPVFLQKAGLIFPATSGYQLMMTQPVFRAASLWPLLLQLAAAAAVCAFLLARKKAE